ncbi:MAG: lactonase family protein [Deinococcales bacterium]
MSLLFVGSYTEKLPHISGEGLGISSYLWQESLSLQSSFPEIRNPSYLCLDKENQRLFALEECDFTQRPALYSFSYDAKGTLKLLKRREIAASAPCHLSLSPDKSLLAVANYGSGDAQLFALSPQGHIGACIAHFDHQALSHAQLQFKHPIRQEAAHAHQVIFSSDGEYLFIIDLGLDAILSYSLKDYQLVGRFDFPAGTGPRHGCFHPHEKHLMVVGELDASVHLLSYDAGQFKSLDRLASLPRPMPDIYPAAIKFSVDGHVNGQKLYVSNRNLGKSVDSISVFKVNPLKQSLEFCDNIPMQGKIPRDFVVTEEALLVGFQDSHELCLFKLDREGNWILKERQVCGSPVCLVTTF